MDSISEPLQRGYLDTRLAKIGYPGRLIIKVSGLQLFGKYIAMLIKTEFQYRANAFFAASGVFVRESVNVIVMVFLLVKFGNINGWNLDEMLFLYSLIFLSYGLLVGLFAGVRDFPEMIQRGTLDMYLTRPMGILYQIISAKADYCAFLGHGTVGVLLFLKTSCAVGIDWNAYSILYYTVSILGGVFIQLSVWLFGASLCIWIVKSEGVIGFLFFNTRKFAGYPLSIFPSFIKIFLMFIIPFAFVNYFPAQFFLRKPDMADFWPGYLYLSPFVGVTFLAVMLLFWSFSLKHYSSTGTTGGV